MAYADTESVTIAVDASGDATAYTTKLYTGVVRAVSYTKSNYANGVDFAITGDVTGQTVWTENDVNSSKTVCPKQATHSTAGVASLYAAGGTAIQADVVLVNERIKFVISSGGVSTSGAFRVIVG